MTQVPGDHCDPIVIAYPRPALFAAKFRQIFCLLLYLLQPNLLSRGLCHPHRLRLVVLSAIFCSSGPSKMGWLPEDWFRNPRFNWFRASDWPAYLQPSALPAHYSPTHCLNRNPSMRWSYYQSCWWNWLRTNFCATLFGRPALIWRSHGPSGIGQLDIGFICCANWNLLRSKGAMTKFRGLGGELLNEGASAHLLLLFC